MNTATFTVPGAAHGKGRPRFVRATGRTYTDTKTVSAEQRIQGEWIAAGRPTFDGPVFLSLEVVIARPKTHWRNGGVLGAAGLRTPFPIRKPDADNILKCFADALNGMAYADDAQIVEGRVVKRWARYGEPEHTTVTIARLVHLREAA